MIAKGPSFIVFTRQIAGGDIIQHPYRRLAGPPDRLPVQLLLDHGVVFGQPSQGLIQLILVTAGHVHEFCDRVLLGPPDGRSARAAMGNTRPDQKPGQLARRATP
jgi:hypothetical protein